VKILKEKNKIGKNTFGWQVEYRQKEKKKKTVSGKEPANLGALARKR